MEVVIITGLSGAGKTKAADWFEDKGYYCIDNMPPALIKNFIDLALSGTKQVTKAAFVVDVRGGLFFHDLKNSVTALESDENVDFKILFIEASNEALIRRYNETRRIHPLSTAAISPEVIDEERRQLAELRSHATYIIDTSSLKVAEFNAELDKLLAQAQVASEQAGGAAAEAEAFRGKEAIAIAAAADARAEAAAIRAETEQILSAASKSVD